MQTLREFPQTLIEYSRNELRDFLHTVSGVDFVMLSSSDGFELASASKKVMQNQGKISAVSSSIMAMVSAFITEIKLEGCQAITLDAENGKVFLSIVGHAEYPMVLMAVANKDTLIGQMRYHLQKLSSDLASINYCKSLA